jgi:4-amino-4-deoxy-L-arabinose transferase-like glycosyltransferase
MIVTVAGNERDPERIALARRRWSRAQWRFAGAFAVMAAWVVFLVHGNGPWIVNVIAGLLLCAVIGFLIPVWTATVELLAALRGRPQDADEADYWRNRA